MPPRILIVTLTLLLGWCGAAAGQPVTRPSTQPADLAFIPDPPKVSPLAGTNWKPRIFFDYNATPIFGWNPKFVNDGRGTEPDRNGRYSWERNGEASEYLLKCGFTPTIIAYNGTLNRAGTWWNFDTNTWDPGVTPGANRWAVLWNKPDGTTREGNFSDPVNPRAVDAICALARKPYAFGAPLKSARPVWTDIEGTATYNPDAYGHPGPVEAVKVAKAWLGMAQEFRRWGNLYTYDQELYTYGGHLWCYYDYLDENTYEQKLKGAATAEEKAKAAKELGAVREFAAVERQHAHLYSGFTGCTYNANQVIESGLDAFAQGVDRYGVIVNKYYPEFRDNKVMYVSPVYTVMWKDSQADEVKALDGQPVPLDLWKSEIDYLVSRGWHVYVWMGYTYDLKPVKPHLDYLLRFK